jgi:hypothetical protein
MGIIGENSRHWTQHEQDCAEGQQGGDNGGSLQEAVIGAFCNTPARPHEERMGRRRMDWEKERANTTAGVRAWGGE